MTSPLAIHLRAKTAARYEVRNFIVLVQRRWGARKGRQEALRPETIKDCRAKFMITDSVNGKRRSGHPFTSRSGKKMKRVLEMFMHCLLKSTY